MFIFKYQVHVDEVLAGLGHVGGTGYGEWLLSADIYEVFCTSFIKGRICQDHFRFLLRIILKWNSCRGGNTEYNILFSREFKIEVISVSK